MALEKRSMHPWLPRTVFAGLTLTILAPLLRSGHIMTLDLAFGPQIPMPEQVTSSYLFRVFLHELNSLLATQVIEKLLFFCILFLSGWGAYKLAIFLNKTKAESIGAFLAGAFYMINPFTYARFMTGQYSVLLGYALMPFFVVALLRFLTKPSRHTSLVMAAWTVLISIISVHSIGIIAVIGLVAGILVLRRSAAQKAQFRRIVLYGSMTIGIVLIASCYWLIPLLQGKGETARIIASFDAGDSQTFATVGQGIIGQVSNVLGLQGFWADDRGLYILPQERTPLWGLAGLVVWMLVIIGIVAWRQKGRRFDLKLLGGAALIAIILSVGGTSGWLAEHIPLFAGFREPHKFVGLLALFYALCIGRAGDRLVTTYRQKWGEIASFIVPAGIVLTLILFTPNMFWGFGGQLQPRHYPSDWFLVQKTLQKDEADHRTLFLPWHLYMHFRFAGRIIANPAPDFFGKQTIVSNDPEFGKASLTSQDSTTQYLSQHVLPNAAENPQLGRTLAQLNIKYILLAKEADADKYDYLNRQKELKLMYEGSSLMLYRNEAFSR